MDYRESGVLARLVQAASTIAESFLSVLIGEIRLLERKRRIMFTKIATLTCNRQCLIETVSTALFVLTIGACASSPQPKEATPPVRNIKSDQKDAIQSQSAIPYRDVSSCRTESVYFAYDSSEITTDARSTLQNNSACLQQNKTDRVTITGMADPRGTEEYNLALGERRAQAAAKYISTMGTGQTAISVRSVGEEYASGEDEESWANDRRAEFELR
jgi:peptidoglycan-associated lipoprotein